jgi:hypothetical protein
MGNRQRAGALVAGLPGAARQVLKMQDKRMIPEEACEVFVLARLPSRRQIAVAFAASMAARAGWLHLGSYCLRYSGAGSSRPGAPATGGAPIFERFFGTVTGVESWAASSSGGQSQLPAQGQK